MTYTHILTKSDTITRIFAAIKSSSGTPHRCGLSNELAHSRHISRAFASFHYESLFPRLAPLPECVPCVCVRFPSFVWNSKLYISH